MKYGQEIQLEKSRMFKRLITDTAFFSIVPSLNRAIGILILPIITVYVTPEEYGCFSYIVTIYSFFLLLFGVGLDATLLKQFYDLEKTLREKYVLNIRP